MKTVVGGGKKGHLDQVYCSGIIVWGYSQSEMNDVVLLSPRGAVGQPIGDIFTLA